MPREHRIWYPGATYHITARGNKRAAIFFNSKDYLKYLHLLEEVRNQYPFKLHSYCLMPNHIHLQLETIQDHIQWIMKGLHTRYAIYFNKRYDFDGHVFQGRYGAKVIENIDYFLEVSRYIHRNPLDANMVKAIMDYPWSSYPAYANNYENPHVEKAKTYSYFTEPVHIKYQKFVHSKSDIIEFWKQDGKIPIGWDNNTNSSI